MFFNTSSAPGENLYACTSTDVWTLSTGGDGPVVCSKFTKTTADLTAASTTEDEVLLSLPAGDAVSYAKIKHSVAFSGGGVTDVSVSVGHTGDATFYAPAFDIDQAVADTIFQMADMFKHHSHAGGDVIARFTAVGGNVNALVSGSVDISLCRIDLP